MDQVTWFQSRMRSEATEEHSHARHQLLATTEGLMLFEDSMQRSILSGANAALIPAGCVHKAQTLGQETAFSTLYFSDASFETSTGSSVDCLPTHIVVFSISSLARSLLQELCKRDEQKALEEPNATMLRLLYLLVMEEHKERLPFSLPQSSHPVVQAVLSLLDQRYAAPLMMDDLTRVAGLSGRSLQRLFQREVGMAPFAYLRLRRVFQASILLTTTETPIVDVALEVGYESLSTFYQAFVHFFGTTPRQYRLRTQPNVGDIAPSSKRVGDVEAYRWASG
ncbi:MAG: AraC family transcriptional regulator [Deltaproteobacteria bacterium]|nr:MAG: AraC family transcriptional regulator [Deltaproteobacteria bacterium]